MLNRRTNSSHFFVADELFKLKSLTVVVFICDEEADEKGGAEGIRGKIASATGVGKKELELFKATVQI